MALAVLLGLAAGSARGQAAGGGAPVRDSLPHRAGESIDSSGAGARLQAVGVWLAHAGSTVDASYGHSPGWSLTLVGARASWQLAGSQRLTMHYTMDVIPAARLSSPDDAPPTICSRGRPCISTRGPAYGIGASPLGLHLAYRAHRAVQLHGGFTAGAMWFTERVPVTTASRMNFTVDLGAGASLVRRDGRSMTLGYRIHHISNGWTAQSNPGIGAHMVSLGFYWGRE